MATDKAENCQAHPQLAQTSKCTQCGKGICRECIREFGYFCGAVCRDAARATITDADREQARQAAAEMQDMSRRAGWFVLGAVAAVLIFVGLGAWLWIVRAPGKVAWIWAPPAATAGEDAEMGILDCTDAAVTLHAGGRVYQIRPADGRQLAAASLELKIQQEPLAWQSTPEAMVGIFPNGMFRLAPAADKASVVAFERRCQAAAIAPDAQTAACLQAPTHQYPAGMEVALERLNEQIAKKLEEEDEAEIEKLVLRQRQLYEKFGHGTTKPARVVGLATGSGEELWSCEAGPEMRIEELVTVGKRFALVEEKIPANFQDKTRTARLALHNFSDGQPAWRLTLKNGIAWGPAAAAGRIALQSGPEFIVFDLEGNQKWSVPVPVREFGGARHLLSGNLALVAQDGGTWCFNLEDGKKLWSCNIAFNGEFLANDGSRLVGSGSLAKAAKAANPLLPGMEGAENMMQEVGGGTLGALQSVLSPPLLVAVELETGRELWRRERFSDSLYGDCRTLVGIPGASPLAVFKMISNFSGGKGAEEEEAEEEGTVIRQLSHKDGATIYSRHVKAAFSACGIAGGRLVGVMGGGRSAPVLAGIRLKK